MPRLCRFLTCAVLFAVAPVHGAAIEHQAVTCVVAERYPQLHARFVSAESVARARVFFRSEARSPWYAVTMTSRGGVLTGVLPKPTKSLKQFTYYVEAADTTFGTARTEEHTATVVRPPGGCQGGLMATGLAAASVLVEAPAGAAAVPAGFSSSGVVVSSSTAVAAGAAGAGAAGAAAAAAAGGMGATTVVLAGAGVLVAGAGVAVAAGALGGDGGDGGGGEPQQSFLGLSGIVYARAVPTPSGQGPDILTDPVAGAVVSTSLDGTTAVTGGDGRFSLVTGVRADPCLPYTVTIRAAGHPTYSVTATWANNFGPPFTFTLSPPGPMPFRSNVCP